MDNKQISDCDKTILLYADYLIACSKNLNSKTVIPKLSKDIMNDGIHDIQHRGIQELIQLMWSGSVHFQRILNGYLEVCERLMKKNDEILTEMTKNIVKHQQSLGWYYEATQWLVCFYSELKDMRS
jgi:hypothetical protein